MPFVCTGAPGCLTGFFSGVTKLPPRGTNSHVTSMAGSATPSCPRDEELGACLRKAGTHFIKHLGNWKHQAKIQGPIDPTSQMLRTGSSVTSTRPCSQHSPTQAADSGSPSSSRDGPGKLLLPAARALSQAELALWQGPWSHGRTSMRR